jgi:plasmid stabilization system protein ParE
MNAERWIQRVWDAVDSLEQFPRRGALAEENDDVDYEVRQLLVGSSTLLFTVDDERNTVWVIALRGEGQLPRPQDLPSGHTALGAERKIDALRQALAEGERSGDAGPLDIDEVLREARARAGHPPSPPKSDV